MTKGRVNIMKKTKAYGWLDLVLLDLVKFAVLNNLQHTAGKLAEVYNLLQAERESKEARPGERFVCKSVTVFMLRRDGANENGLLRDSC